LDKIAAAFVKAQKSFSPALKTHTNPAFKSKYADLSACIEAVIDALGANEIALVQKTHNDSTGVTVETVFLHSSGESFASGMLHVPASKQDPQGYGSALTYARRYSLMAACGIAPEDDDGNAASKAKPIPISGQQADDLASLADEVNADLPALFEWISKNVGRKVSKFSEIHTGEITRIKSALEAKKVKA
jgi:hypothetical protein